MDDIILYTVTVTERVPDTLRWIGIIDLGIPTGFRIFWEDFQKAIEEYKIFKYEITKRQLSLYLPALSYNDPLSITYRLKAKNQLMVSKTKSSVYNY